MRSVRTLLFVAGTLLALSATAGVVSATSRKSFHLDKTCSDDPSEPLGFFCTIQHSDYKWIPPGTEIHYAAGPTDNAQIATITVPNGSTTGVCVWSSDMDAVCSFKGGSGRLARFNLEVVVTANADQSVWYWDGSYWVGGGD